MNEYVVIYLSEGALHIDQMTNKTLQRKVIRQEVFILKKFKPDGATLKQDPNFPVDAATYIADCAKLQLIDHREES